MRGRDRRIAGAVALLVLVACVSAATAQEVRPSKDDLYQEYVHMRAINAVLLARLNLSKQSDAYLILDLPEREVRLELQGVTLTRVPAREIKLNRLAREISRDTTRIAFCEVPFVLQHDKWFEEIPTLAAKDTAAVMSAPDTTGALAERIRTAPVMALLQFERNLVLVLKGEIPPTGRLERWKNSLRSAWRSLRPQTAEASLREERRRSVLIEFDMEPALVRSLAPNLTKGTKLVLRF